MTETDSLVQRTSGAWVKPGQEADLRPRPRRGADVRFSGTTDGYLCFSRSLSQSIRKQDPGNTFRSG
jgi:hypothetical protein